MASIIVRMKDGTRRDFLHVGRPGGSYTNSIRYEGGFAIITDEYENQTAIPSGDIAEVHVQSDQRGGW